MKQNSEEKTLVVWTSSKLPEDTPADAALLETRSHACKTSRMEKKQKKQKNLKDDKA